MLKQRKQICRRNDRKCWTKQLQGQVTGSLSEAATAQERSSTTVTGKNHRKMRRSSGTYWSMQNYLEGSNHQPFKVSWLVIGCSWVRCACQFPAQVCLMRVTEGKRVQRKREQKQGTRYTGSPGAWRAVLYSFTVSSGSTLVTPVTGRSFFGTAAHCILIPAAFGWEAGFTYHTNACLRTVGMWRTHFLPLETFYCATNHCTTLLPHLPISLN